MLLRTTLILLFVTFAANAEVKLTETDILGTWQIDSESNNSDGSHAKKLSSTWTFRNDGTMEGMSTDSDINARSSEIRAIVQYSVEDGKIIKQTVPGRSKFETCTAVEKNAQKMTLECNNVYFFMTKK
ncbi:conserved exported hypothetical protein [Crenothrix polyspora]|jgi:hypothetical protein|uniref:Lipocalin-like domain-containing protein n=1 Tax=Crenothrix polyspora TaxID=360316 RepID=A0A1R4H0N6_9GAMM|nr:hypothetical protein [Crenothrix polyspora]SJM89817.1 conserved exported hypothetical protein [Crenothrix polyspora]